MKAAVNPVKALLNHLVHLTRPLAAQHGGNAVSVEMESLLSQVPTPLVPVASGDQAAVVGALAKLEARVAALEMQIAALMPPESVPVSLI